MRAALCFVAAVMLGAAWSGQLSACVMSSGDCNCPPTPEQPDPQAQLPIDEASAFSAAGDEDVCRPTRAAEPWRSAGDPVVIRYRHDGMAREVVYDVSPIE